MGGREFLGTLSGVPSRESFESASESAPAIGLEGVCLRGMLPKPIETAEAEEPVPNGVTIGNSLRTQVAFFVGVDTKA
jgi:hypothetical protein